MSIKRLVSANIALLACLSFMGNTAAFAQDNITTNDDDSYLILGDADGNGQITVNDALYLLEYSVGIENKGWISLAPCDMNSDGKIDISDANIILDNVVCKNSPVSVTAGKPKKNSKFPNICYTIDGKEYVQYFKYDKINGTNDGKSLTISLPNADKYFEGYEIEMQTENGFVFLCDLDQSNDFAYTIKYTSAEPIVLRAKAFDEEQYYVTTQTQEFSPEIQPAVFKAENVFCNSAQLTWSQVKNADGYKIYVYDKDGNPQEYKEISGNTYSFTVDKLTSNSSYKYGIASFMQIGSDRVYSDITTVDFVTPSEKTNLSRKSATTDSLTLQWDKCDGASGYEISIYKDEKWQIVSDIQNADTTTAEISSLEAGTDYQFKIRPYTIYNNSRYDGEYSEFTTCTRPDKVNINSFTLNGTTADISWKGVRCNGYSIQRLIDGEWKTIVKIKDPTKTSYTVKDLPLGERINLRVAAYNDIKNTGKEFIYGAVSKECKTILSVKGESQQFGGDFENGAVCGPVSATVFMNSEKGTDYDKDEIIYHMINHGYYFGNLHNSHNAGVGPTDIKKMLKDFGYSCRNVYTWNKSASQTMKEQIDKGKRCLILMHYHFNPVNSGHFVTVIGYWYDENGQLMIEYQDPYSSGTFIPSEQGEIKSAPAYKVDNMNNWVRSGGTYHIMVMD